MPATQLKDTYRPGDKIVYMPSNSVYTVKGLDEFNRSILIEEGNSWIHARDIEPIDQAIKILKDRVSYLEFRKLCKMDKLKLKIKEIRLMAREEGWSPNEYEMVKRELRGLYPEDTSIMAEVRNGL